MPVNFSLAAAGVVQSAYGLRKKNKAEVLNAVGRIKGIVKVFEKSEMREMHGYLAALHDHVPDQLFTRFSVEHGSAASRTFLVLGCEFQVVAALERMFPETVVSLVMES